MKVRIQAVRWEGSAGVPIADLFGHLQVKFASPGECTKKHQFEFGGKPRFLFMNHKGDFRVALLMTLRDPKGAIEAYVDENGRMVFTSKEPDAAANKLAEFNYLVMNEKTGIGLYSDHYGATPFKKLTSFARSEFIEIKHARIAAEIKKGVTEGKAIKKFSGYLRGTAFLTKQGAGQLVQQLKEIDSIALSFDTLETTGGFFQPYSNIARSASHLIRFARTAPIARTRAAVVDMITKLPGVRGVVNGRNQNDVDKIIHLKQNLGVIDEFEHGDAIRDWQFRPEDLTHGAVVKRMITQININPAHFTTPVKPKKQKKSEESRSDKKKTVKK